MLLITLVCVFACVFVCLFVCLFSSQDHNGHSFFTEQFKVAAVCEYCNDPIPLLEKGDVCLGIYNVYQNTHVQCIT